MSIFTRLLHSEKRFLAAVALERSRRRIPPSLDIRANGKGDSPEEALEKCLGGWLVDLAAFPETRPIVEDYFCAAMDRGYQHGKRGEVDAAAKWQLVANRLLAVLGYAGGAAFARKVSSEQGASTRES